MNIALRITDFVALAPLLLLLGGALILLLLESFAEKASSTYSFYFTLGILIAAAIAAFFLPSNQNPLLTPWIRFDNLGKFFTLFFIMIGIAAALLSFTFFQHFEATRGEFFFLLLSAVFG